MDYENMSVQELEKILEQKKVQKNKHTLKEKTQKILLNSLYGCLGNQYFLFYDIRIAEAITVTGQYIIRYVANNVDTLLRSATGQKEDTRIYGDTDSVGFNVHPIIKKYMEGDTKEEKIRKVTKFADTVLDSKIKSLCKTFCDQVHAYDPDALDMERENIYESALIVKKKKYAFSIIDSEGVVYATPKVKITGLESKKAVFHQTIRDKLADSYKMMLYKSQDEFVEFIEDFKKEFMEFDIEKIAEFKGVNGMEKYHNLGKGTPKHVRASINHNNWIKEKKVDHLINPILTGDKIKFIHLVDLNPLKSPVFAFEGDWREEYELDDYIDRNKQFEQCVIKPIRNVSDVIGFDTERKVIHGLF